MKPATTNSPKLHGLTFIVRALRYRNYRLFFGGQMISLIGTWMTTTATSWLVYRLTGSAIFLGIVAFTSQIPAFIFAPIAGIVVDRMSCRNLLLITQFLSMLQSIALAILTLSHQITIPWILFLGAFQGMINAFDVPCRHTFVVEMIEKKEDLGNAIALNSSMFNLSRLIGPAIGGIIIACVGEGWCFFIDSISYAAVMIALSAMVIKDQSKSKHAGAPWQQLKEGCHYALHSKPIRSIIGLFAIVSFMGVPYGALLPIFAKSILGGGPHTLGFLMAAAGSGALLGAIWLASRKTVLGLGRVIPLATAALGTGLIAFSFSHTLWLSLVLLVMIGGGLMLMMASSNTILQTIVEDNKRGRIMSLFIMAYTGASPLGSLMAGSLSQTLGAPNMLRIGGCCCLLGCLWFYRKLPEIRKSIRPIYVDLGIIQEMGMSRRKTSAELSLAPEE